MANKISRDNEEVKILPGQMTIFDMLETEHTDDFSYEYEYLTTNNNNTNMGSFTSPQCEGRSSFLRKLRNK